MRIRLVICLLVLTSSAPAHAHIGPNATKVTFSGAVPCTVACASWLGKVFAPCEKPFPPGSYVDALTSPAPEAPAGRTILLEATLDPEMDWDSWLCESEAPYREMAEGAHDRRRLCHHDSPFGCHEDMSATVQPGQVVIFRAYNWNDVAPATGRYWFRVI